MTDFIIAPSILNADFARLGEEVDALVKAGADMIHLDVMDNHYVPNLTFGPMLCQSLRQYGVSLPMDVHLMVEPVDALAAMFADAGASYISFHPEASRHIDRSIEAIIDAGCKPGLVLNPATPLSLIEPVLAKIDLLLLMSVNPGFGGQQFLPYVMDKIRDARARIDALGKPIRLEVDGGIKASNIGNLARAGADTFVVGSAITSSGDYQRAIAELRQQLSQ